VLKSRLNFPAGGFLFYEPRTGWTSTPHIGFDDTVKEIIRHRNANKGRFDWNTDRASVEHELEAYTEARLRSMTGGEQWLTDAPSTDPPVFIPRPRNRPGASAAGEPGTVRKVVAGVGAVLAWLGSGLKPVDHQTANARASICITCPQNKRLEGIEKAIGTAGDILHSIMEAKNQMKLSTPDDDKLHQCAACLCVLQTKVFAPAEHVRKGITPEIEKELTSFCWIRPLL